MKKNNKTLEIGAKTFAASRGWKLARREADLFEIAAGRRSNWRTGFASDQLGRMFDHAEFYEWAGSRRPAAIVVHPYGHFSQAQVDAVAKLYGLKGQILPQSWYHPNAQAIVFESLLPQSCRFPAITSNAERPAPTLIKTA